MQSLRNSRSEGKEYSLVKGSMGSVTDPPSLILIGCLLAHHLTEILRYSMEQLKTMWLTDCQPCRVGRAVQKSLHIKMQKKYHSYNLNNCSCFKRHVKSSFNVV